MRHVLAAGLALWLASLPILAHQRVWVWQDETAIWTSAAWWSPSKVRPLVQLGTLAHQRGERAQAESFYRQAMSAYMHGRPLHERVGCRAAALNLATLMQAGGQWGAAEFWASYPC